MFFFTAGIKKNLICRILLLVRPIRYIEAVITLPGHIDQCFNESGHLFLKVVMGNKLDNIIFVNSKSVN